MEMFRYIAKVSTNIRQLMEPKLITTETVGIRRFLLKGIPKQFKDFGPIYHMDQIWKELPYDLVRLILSFTDDIDVRLYFGILPRKLKINNNFNFRNEYVYDTESLTLRQFVWYGGTAAHSIRRGIKFDQIREQILHVFNMAWEEYEIEVVSRDFKMGPIISRDHVIINKQIKFR
jgi:hypothetical protein